MFCRCSTSFLLTSSLSSVLFPSPGREVSLFLSLTLSFNESLLILLITKGNTVKFTTARVVITHSLKDVSTLPFRVQNLE